MTDAQAKKIDTMSFEAAMAELEEIVQKLEAGSGELESSIKSYERGVALKRHCEAKLKEAQEKIEKITVAPDGSVSTEPFEVE